MQLQQDFNPTNIINQFLHAPQTPSIASKATEYKRIKALMSTLNDQLDEVKDFIKSEMDKMNVEKYTTENGDTVRYTLKPRSSIDSKKLQAEHPALYAE